MRAVSRYNAHNTFSELFNLGVIPIVNENDTVATYEIEIGDSDTFSFQNFMYDAKVPAVGNDHIRIGFGSNDCRCVPIYGDSSIKFLFKTRMAPSSIWEKSMETKALIRKRVLAPLQIPANQSPRRDFLKRAFRYFLLPKFYSGRKAWRQRHSLGNGSLR